MKKKKKVLVFVFDGFADWELSYAMVGINMSNTYEVKTIAMDMNLKKSMGGVTVLPDVDFFPETDLKDMDESVAMLLLPGGVAWEQKMNNGIAPLVEHCVQSGIPVAAICGATLLLGDLGILNDHAHTSNEMAYLEAFSPGYRGQRFYQFLPSVSHRGVITAAGTAPLELAANIFEELGISEHPEVASWFRYFQNKALNFKPITSDLVERSN